MISTFDQMKALFGVFCPNTAARSELYTAYGIYELVEWKELIAYQEKAYTEKTFGTPSHKQTMVNLRERFGVAKLELLKKYNLEHYK